MIKVVVIKFKNGGKLYYFAPKEGEVYERNMPVIVETAKGLEYAWVAYPTREVEEEEVVDDRGHEDRDADIDQVIHHQDSCQEHIRILKQGQNGTVTAIAAIGHLLLLTVCEREKSRLGTRNKRRDTKQGNRYDKHNDCICIKTLICYC